LVVLDIDPFIAHLGGSMYKEELLMEYLMK
jgi:hypothetical protein